RPFDSKRDNKAPTSPRRTASGLIRTKERSLMAASLRRGSRNGRILGLRLELLQSLAQHEAEDPQASEEAPDEPHARSQQPHQHRPELAEPAERVSDLR